jgi:uncharacterized protein YrrD
MLRSINDLRGLTIRATDDEIGSVDEFFFDDQQWSVRYLVVNTGNWLLNEPVLISPRSIRSVNWESRQVAVNLTRQQVQNAPSTETDRPVSRQMELEHALYYNYEPYWYGPGVWGSMGFPYYTGVAGYIPAEMDAIERERKQPTGDLHLRSTREVTGYHIHASDGEIGHVSDFVMDDATWEVRYLVVDTRNWLPGKKVLVAPAWISGVNWNNRTVDVDLVRETIKAGPEYDPAQLNRDYEERLYHHYQRPAYWDEVLTAH